LSPPPANILRLSAVLIERESLRYTPAGIPMLNARVAHQSEQHEAKMPRSVEIEVAAVFAGQLAEEASRLPIGQKLELTGFLAPRRRQSKSLVLHVSKFELNEV
jgi:primosomal replication protein N